MSVERIVSAVVILVITVVVAQIVDRLFRRRKALTPEALTRYNAVRRAVYILIVVVGVAMAAFVFPTVRGVAGGLLASAAVLSVVAGIAARSSLGNFISGLVLSFAQPIRIGDSIEFRGATGVVEDIGRVYTRVRTHEGSWVHVPNDLLVSDTIVNWTIVEPECTARVRLLLPLSTDLGHAMKLLLDEARGVSGALPGREPSVLVTELAGDRVELAADVWLPGHAVADRVSSELRGRIQGRLRAAGLLPE